MQAFPKLVAMLICIALLIGCGPEAYEPQVLPTPGPDQERISLRLDQLRVERPTANVVLLVHVVVEGRIPSGLRYPENGYIIMEGGTRRGTTDIYHRVATIPLVNAEETAIIVTAVSVPSTVSQFAIQNTIDGLAQVAKGYASTVVRERISSYLARKVIDALAGRIEEEISDGQVLAMYRFKLAADGTVVAERAPGYDGASLTAQAELMRVVATSVPVAAGPTEPLPGAGAAPNTPSVDQAAEQHQRIQEAVRLFIEQQMVAARQPDRDALWAQVYRNMAGSLRTEMADYRADLQRKGVYEVQDWRAYQVLDSRIDGDTAQVETLEGWYNEKFDVGTGACRYRQGPYTAQFTYTLQWRGQAGWVIIAMAASGVPGDEPC